MGLLSKFLKHIDIDAKDGCGNTPLHEAILGQHIDIARWLVKQGANVYSRNNSDLRLINSPSIQIQFIIFEF